MHNIYRPKTFEDFIGNKEVVDSLQNLLSLPFEKRVPTYILSGSLGSGKCVTEDTLIITERGIEPIASYKSGIDGFTRSSTKVYSTNTMENASHFFEENSTETIEITNSLGMIIRGTKEHPVLTLNDDCTYSFKQLQNLNKNDIVCIKRGMHKFPNNNVKINFEYKKNEHDYSSTTLEHMPLTITPDLARLLGYVIANGSSHKHKFHMSTKNLVLQEDLRTILKPYNQRLGKLQRETTFPIGGIQLGTFIEYLLEGKMGTARFKKVPRCILQSGKEIQINFLRSLIDCDGYSYKNSYIEYYTASKTLGRQVQFILLNLGIVGVLRKKYVEKYNYNYYTLAIYGKEYDKYLDVVGSLKYKKDTVVKRNPNNDVIPNLNKIIANKLIEIKKELGITAAGTFYLKGVYTRSPRLSISQTQDITYEGLTNFIANLQTISEYSTKAQELLALCKVHLDNKYFYSKVVETKLIKEPVRVYDFSIPTTHTFISNGYISHNTTLAYIIAKELGGTRPGVDLVEINASSDRGINTARDIIEEATTPSLLTKIKVFILDECNNLTSEASKALLTITERPPLGIYFIITTLYPEKLHPALLSRGVHYRMKSMDREDALTLLRRVLATETDIKISKQNVEILLQYAKGIPRSLLVGLNIIRGCKTTEEAGELLSEFEFSQTPELMEIVRGIANQMNLGLFQELLRQSYDMLKAKPEECRIALGRYLAKIALSPSNTAEMRDLADIVSLFSDPILANCGDIKLIPAIIEAYYRMATIKNRHNS